MNKLLAVLISGTVIMMITVPFLYPQAKIELPILSLKLPHSSQTIFWSNNLTTFDSSRNGLTFDSVKTVLKDTVAKKKSTAKEYHMKKSPWLAVLFSAIIPGGGQLYNQSYWKVPIILGLSAYLGYEIYDNNKTFRNYRDLYAESQINFPPLGDPAILSVREFYRNQRDDFIWYFMIVYVINLVDAYVDAHLFDFTVKEDKIILPGIIDRRIDLRMNIKF